MIPCGGAAGGVYVMGRSQTPLRGNYNGGRGGQGGQ